MKTDKDSEREDRILDEIVVDSNGSDEVVMGWYYHLDDNLQVPFEATCIVDRSMSPLKLNEMVKVIGMADMDDCGSEMLVLIEFLQRELAVPLMQLQPIDADEKTIEAVEDWQYWVNQGKVF